MDKIFLPDICNCTEAAQRSPHHTSWIRVFLHYRGCDNDRGAPSDHTSLGGYAACGASHGTRTRNFQRDRLVL